MLFAKSTLRTFTMTGPYASSVSLLVIVLATSSPVNANAEGAGNDVIHTLQQSISVHEVSSEEARLVKEYITDELSDSTNHANALNTNKLYEVVGEWTMTPGWREENQPPSEVTAFIGAAACVRIIEHEDYALAELYTHYTGNLVPYYHEIGGLVENNERFYAYLIQSVRAKAYSQASLMYDGKPFGAMVPVGPLRILASAAEDRSVRRFLVYYPFEAGSPIMASIAAGDLIALQESIGAYYKYVLSEAKLADEFLQVVLQRENTQIEKVLLEELNESSN